MTPDLTPEKRFIRGPVYVFLGLGFLAMQLGVLPTGIIGAACLRLPLALVLEPLGERTPVLKDYLGGARLPVTASDIKILQTLKHDDHGNSDHGAIVRYFEKLAKIELKRAAP